MAIQSPLACDFKPFGAIKDGAWFGGFPFMYTHTISFYLLTNSFISLSAIPLRPDYFHATTKLRQISERVKRPEVERSAWRREGDFVPGEALFVWRLHQSLSRRQAGSPSSRSLDSRCFQSSSLPLKLDDLCIICVLRCHLEIICPGLKNLLMILLLKMLEEIFLCDFHFILFWYWDLFFSSKNNGEKPHRLLYNSKDLAETGVGGVLARWHRGKKF